MSGGSFDYACFRVEQFADDLDMRLDNAGKDTQGQGWLEPKFEPATMAKLREISSLARNTAKLMKAAEWLYSGDTSDKSFMDEVSSPEIMARLIGVVE